jgi:large subunit ribosomal protein L13
MSFPGQILQRCWHLVDAKGQTVGRLANQIASILKGKHKPTYQANKDMGDYVVVINAEQIELTGTKWKNKLYRWHTGYPGGLKQRTATEMIQRNPTKILRKAILGMIPRTTLRHKFIEPRLKIYTGPEHPHTAQLTSSVTPLPPVPSKLNGTFGFGLQYYAHPASYQPHVIKTATATKGKIN